MKDLVGISAGSLENQLAEHWAYFWRNPYSLGEGFKEVAVVVEAA